jgi:hypothetical protein
MIPKRPAYPMILPLSGKVGSGNMSAVNALGSFDGCFFQVIRRTWWVLDTQAVA